MNNLAITIIIIIVICVSCACYYFNYSTPIDTTSLILQQLWMEHMWYTREYLLRAVYKLPNLSDTATRLLRNQVDLATQINKIYPGSFNTVLSLLRSHILIATQIVTAAMNKDPNFNAINKKWYDNGKQIADALSTLNANYDKTTLENMLKMHLDTTTKELVALLTNQPGINEYDAAVNHMMKFNYYLLNP